MLSFFYVQKCLDQNVSRPKSQYPSEILTNYLTQIWNPTWCCTIPGQIGSDNNDDERVIPLSPTQINRLHRGPNNRLQCPALNRLTLVLEIFGKKNT